MMDSATSRQKIFGLKTLPSFCHELRTPFLWQAGSRQTKLTATQTLAFAFNDSTMFSDVKRVFSVLLQSFMGKSEEGEGCQSFQPLLPSSFSSETTACHHAGHFACSSTW